MTERIERLLNVLANKEHHVYRRRLEPWEWDEIAHRIRLTDYSTMSRVVRRLHSFLSIEKPVLLRDEQIVGKRTIIAFPDIYTSEEMSNLKTSHFIHEFGKVCNICPDYEGVLKYGLISRKKEAILKLHRECESKSDTEVEFLSAVVETIDIVEAFFDKYAAAADEAGRLDLGAALRRIVRTGAKSFFEALQLLRLLHLILWCAGNYHNTLGRIDQYLFPYLQNDIDSGILDISSAQELVEEFFITFNWDSDLYPGVQQGDNGQSVVLGGIKPQGDVGYNILSELCLNASLRLNLIDPKINLRVNSKTPLEAYRLGTELTRKGLGFPQYSNDDVVIPGLLGLGYSETDAKNYVVAACWEFIIPGSGMDIPNIGAICLANTVKRSMEAHLTECRTFSDFLACTSRRLADEAVELAEKLKNLYMEPAPFLSVLMKNCIESGKDISQGGVYNNYGIHGTGFSVAVDSLAAVREAVFNDKMISAADFVDALKNDYQTNPELKRWLRYDACKLGRDDEAIELASWLLDAFADALRSLINERGGRFRPGTGSAMYYLWHTATLGATADGRSADEPLPANYSPSLFAPIDGPLTVIRAFARPELVRVINGGPLTLEMHDTVFRNSEGVEKVAQLVKFFIELGGHQLQLNAVNREKLLEAQAKPEKHRNLIVRVWGWSGYFIELEKEYQDHIIKRLEFTSIR